MLNGFKQFILRGNVVDLAVGIIIGAAFGNIVTAFVKDLLTPFIGIFGQIPNFSNLTFAIRGSNFMYGDFINVLISFLISASTIYFFVIVPINKLTHLRHRHDPPADPTVKKCPECLSEVPIQATRCAFCTIQFNQTKA